MLSVEPAAIVPTLAAEPALVRVTVLPLAVVAVVGVRVGVVVRVVVLGAEVVVRAEVVGVGVPAGTSVNAGCAALSRFARAMSRLSEVSWASVSSVLLSPHAATTIASDSAAVSRGIYWNISFLLV
jgi:hypothetical protein